MNEPLTPWEERLRATAQAFAYPPTPDIGGAVRRRLEGGDANTGGRVAAPALRRRLAWTLLLALLLTGLLRVPEVRARLRAWLRIGTVELTVIDPTPANGFPAPAANGVPQASPTSGTPAEPGVIIAPVTATPREELPRLRSLGGATSLDEARRALPFAIPLPGEPADLGPPDRVFTPEPSGHIAVLVWLAPETTDQVTLSLHILDSESWASKMIHHDQALQTTVGEAQAVWLRGAHELFLYNPQTDDQYIQPQIVTGNVLIWAANGLTYRLETSARLEQARRIAESIR